MTTLSAPVNTGANFQAMLTRDRHDTRSNAERVAETVAEMRRLVIADWAELDNDTELMVPDTSIAYAFARHGAVWEPDAMRFNLGGFIRGGSITIGTTTFYPDGSITGTITPPAHRGELERRPGSAGPHLHFEAAPTSWWKRWTA